MPVIILCSEAQKEELVSNGIKEGAEIIWADGISDFTQYKNATAFIDLLFENSQERIKILNELLPATIIINSVLDTVAETSPSFIRINGWTTFLSSTIIEAAGSSEKKIRRSTSIFFFKKEIEWLPDVVGFVTPRIISMIINEAWFALAEHLSTEEEIDIAMKLGTAYPFGPLEWGNKIGLQNIVTLLQKLSIQQPRYTPCELLVQETNKSI